MTKNQMRRAKLKEKKAEVRSTATILQYRHTDNLQAKKAPATAQNDVNAESPAPEIKSETNGDAQPADPAPQNDGEDVSQVEISAIDISEDDPNYEMYKQIFDKFGVTQDTTEEADKEADKDKGEVFYSDDEDIPSDPEDAAKEEQRLSKKARKAAAKLSVAELKALVSKPELVEWTDTSAPDPRLLVHIKSHRNVVPVPNHWSLKREYLSSKRGVEKPPFSLPPFIAATGISEMRDAVLEKSADASLKQKQRERVQPKMGKLDIDYQKLYEAFFRHQTKPELTRYGEVYYEGKEWETNLKHLRPGELSDELKEALNIPPGAPPPWLINMQRFGPPPSYPSLKIPGLNAPPPVGSTWGFHPGGYGKPPVDEFNRPLYGGDIFGFLEQAVNTQAGEPIERILWGELQAPEEEEESEEEESEDEDEEDENDMKGLETPGGLVTPGGMASAVPSEYPEADGREFDLRKERRGTETEEYTGPRSAYTVIPERQARVEGFFGGDRAYDVSAATGRPHGVPVMGEEGERKRKKAGDVEISVDPEQLEGNDELLRQRYDAARREQGVAGVKGSGKWGTEEDLSEMIESESRKRQKRDEERRRERR